MIIAISTNNTSRFAEVPGRSQNAAYCTFVSNAGFTPILVPMEADPVVIAEIADGLLLPGGIDIDPIHYGLSNTYSFNIDPEKDASERALFHTFREFKKPIFGICRGFQLIFRELLNEHESKDEYSMYFEYLENIGEHTQTSGISVPRRFPSHQVRANLPSLMNTGQDTELGLTAVNSMHHQAVIYNFGQALEDTIPEVKKFGSYDKNEPYLLDIEDVEVCAWSMRGVRQPLKENKKPDYKNYWAILEAAKIHNWGGPIMGVQWHPEELGDIRILRNFFNGPVGKTITKGV